MRGAVGGLWRNVGIDDCGVTLPRYQMKAY